MNKTLPWWSLVIVGLVLMSIGGNLHGVIGSILAISGFFFLVAGMIQGVTTGRRKKS